MRMGLRWGWPACEDAPITAASPGSTEPVNIAGLHHLLPPPKPCPWEAALHGMAAACPPRIQEPAAEQHRIPQRRRAPGLSHTPCDENRAAEPPPHTSIHRLVR